MLLSFGQLDGLKLLLLLCFFFGVCVFFLLSSPKLRDSTPTPALQRNGSGGGSQAAGQLGTGTPVAGSMGPSPHMMRRGKNLHPKVVQ